MANNSNKEEPATAPKSNCWYNISLGSSFKDQHQPSSKFCTLRYEFKPASIDKNQPGLLHKSKDNRVKVEFENNQPGKPKVTFEGASEDYKDNDAVLFFDGETLRLERLHRAVKRLRHNRQPGESASLAASAGPSAESYSPPLGKGLKPESSNKVLVPPLPLLVGHIDTSDFESGEPRKESSIPNKPTVSPDRKSYESEEQVDIVNDDDDNDGLGIAKEDNASENVSTGISIDINEPHHNDMDDEIADVDVSDDEEQNVGQSAAEALRARVNAEEKEEKEEHSSSSSSSSGSESNGSGSGSGSSSSDSESNDGGDSVISI
ncbi:ell-associated factor Eaf-like isoform 2 [Hibiscus syriacus]|uniref:Ell-associated factor Eaf-like isoform 2 n=1 Tax=Hibiscus syriacus TaxID=106335 RepID=A0A6A2ZUH9_HIBSY|nr:suppressor protein SRP40-like [Hibiscus syriacus]KAE8695206.1 ell-associated factor Eaf-like isoform 2 [Hibiscus syriacus]